MPSLVEIDPVVVEKEEFLNYVNVFLQFLIISPWNRMGPSFEETWIPFTQGWLMSSLVEIGQVVLETKNF